MSSGPDATDCSLPGARDRLHQQRVAGVGAHRLEFAGGADEPERRGGQPQLVGGQPAQALPVGGEPDGASAGHQLGARALESLEGLGRDRVGGGDHEVRLQPPDRLRQLVGVGHRCHQRLVGHPVRGRVRALVDGDHPRTEAPQGDRQFPAELTGTQQDHSRPDVDFLHRRLRGRGEHGRLVVWSFGHAVSHRSRIGPSRRPQGWPGSSRTISPLASASTASLRPRASTSSAATKALRPSVLVTRPRTASGASIGVILR